MADLSAEASLSLGDSCQVDENYTEAIDLYAAALSVVRASEDLIKFRALSHKSGALLKLERCEESLEDSQEALDLLSSGLSGLRSGEGEICQKRKGLAAFQLKKYAEAKEALQQAMQLASLNNRPVVEYKKVIDMCDDRLKPASSLKSKEESKPTTAAASKSTSKPASKSAAKAEEKSSGKKKPEPVFKTIGTLVSESSTRTAGFGSANQKPSMPKYQYYQDDKFMKIAILEAGITEKDVHINLGTKQLTVIIKKQGIEYTVIANILYTEIVVEKSKVLFKDEKILIKLKKESEKYEWHELFGKNEEFKSSLPPKPKVAAQPSHPYSSDKDWDKVEKDVIDEEKNEKPPPGENQMNKFFQQIYSDANEETRRAMIKSYQTSGGTVLSCNWDEVQGKDYENERIAPKGMEWKNWEGKKLAMKKDDDDK